MIIHCTSDLHGNIPYLPGGDLLIVAGDVLGFGMWAEAAMFASWLDSLESYKEKVVIAGNHDLCLACGRNPFKKAHYLNDSGVTLFGIKIWGSPITPEFMHWAFMRTRGEQIREIWDKIPDDTDILITHGPPAGILDQNEKGVHCGCLDLRDAVKRIRPKLHIFGHIHEQFGQVEDGSTTYVNCSYVDEHYRPRGQYQSIDYFHWGAL